jgi:hypothetical protein
MRSTRTDRARPPRALTYDRIHLPTFGRVVDLLQVDRSGVYLGVQAGATVVGVQGELSRASSAVWGGDGALIGVVGDGTRRTRGVTTKSVRGQDALSDSGARHPTSI